jgi:two-component system NtrC family response regulator/two-component system response regulator AtoC
MTPVVRRDDQAAEDAPLPGMIGEHPLMKEVYRLVRRVAPTDDPVMLVGETGTGKELVAKALHELSPRRSRQLISVNAAALPETLFESELFGYERGAYSEARQAKPGLLEVAHQSTLHLDELGALGWAGQAKLLRVVEEGVVRRLGGLSPRAAAPRWVASCQGLGGSGVGLGIREDLWHRLAVVLVVLPPLRSRVSDIPLLVAHFLEDRRFPSDRLDPGALEVICSAAWPGNVRQLKQMVGRLALRVNGGWLTGDVVQEEFESLGDPDARSERARFRATLEAHSWNMRAAAAALGLTRASLYRRLQALSLMRPPRAPSRPKVSGVTGHVPDTRYTLNQDRIANQ